jgi:hypothetical protein
MSKKEMILSSSTFLYRQILCSFYPIDHICVQFVKVQFIANYNTVHITDYFQFVFSMLPPDFSNQPTNNVEARDLFFLI